MSSFEVDFKEQQMGRELHILDPLWNRLQKETDGTIETSLYDGADQFLALPD